MFEASDKCNLHNIKHIECDEFEDELINSPDTLRRDDAEAYFKIILSLFKKKDQPNEELDKKKMSLLLSTLYKVLAKKEFRQIFVNERYSPALPFSRKETYEELLNILLLLAKKSPEVFDATVCSSFDNIVSRRGQNSFIILYNYCENQNYCIDFPPKPKTPSENEQSPKKSQKSEKTSKKSQKNGESNENKKEKYTNPWPMLDILFSDECKGQDRFLKPDLCKEYARLLTRLCVNCPNVQEYYKQKPFEIITKLLIRFADDSDDEKTMKMKPDLESIREAYSCLAQIASIPEFAKKYPLSIEYNLILQHLKEPTLVRSALELLLVTTDYFPKLEPSDDDDIVFQQKKKDFQIYLKNLIRIAALGAEDRKDSIVNNSKLAALILMRLAKREDIANLLIEQPTWMEKDLPDFFSTFQLFLVVYGHKALRRKLVSDPEFLIFLNILVSNAGTAKRKQKIQLLEMCLKIFRHMNDPVTPDPQQTQRSFTCTEEFLEDLSDSNFVSNFIETAAEVRDEEEEDATYQIILLLDTIGSNYVTPQLMPYLKNLNDYIQQDINFDHALTAATHLAKHKEYAQKFKDMELHKYIKKKYQKQSPEYEKIRRRINTFLNTLKKVLPKKQ